MLCLNLNPQTELSVWILTCSASSHAHDHCCIHLVNLCYLSIWPVLLGASSCHSSSRKNVEQRWWKKLNMHLSFFGPYNHIKLWRVVMHRELSTPFFWHWTTETKKPSCFNPSLKTCWWGICGCAGWHPLQLWFPWSKCRALRLHGLPTADAVV